MASRDFDLVRYEYKRVDGKGRVLTAHQTPSAIVRASKADTDTDIESGMLLAYYSAQAAGILGQMKFGAPDGASDLDRALALFDSYTFTAVALDDDGNPVKPGGEPDPTAPSSPASAS